MEQKEAMAQDQIGGSSSSRIPTVKIKIRKKVEDEEEEEEEAIKRHCCKECNKSFSSGKALGGHMSSAHVQANKDLKPTSKRKTSAAAASDAAYACMLCHKSFNSKKSLFGHMRCHPEREWRGMEPPPEEDTSAGLGFNLKSWASSNKRGRGRAAQDKENESFMAGLHLIKMLKTDSGETSHKEKENEDCEELYNTAIQVLATVKRDKKALEQNLECSTHLALGGACKTSPTKKKKRNYSYNEEGGDASAFTFAFDLNMAPQEEESEDVGGGASSNHRS